MPGEQNNLEGEHEQTGGKGTHVNIATFICRLKIWETLGRISLPDGVGMPDGAGRLKCCLCLPDGVGMPDGAGRLKLKGEI